MYIGPFDFFCAAMLKLSKTVHFTWEMHKLYFTIEEII